MNRLHDACMRPIIMPFNQIVLHMFNQKPQKLRIKMYK